MTAAKGAKFRININFHILKSRNNLARPIVACKYIKTKELAGRSAKRNWDSCIFPAFSAYWFDVVACLPIGLLITITVLALFDRWLPKPWHLSTKTVNDGRLLQDTRGATDRQQWGHKKSVSVIMIDLLRLSKTEKKHNFLVEKVEEQVEQIDPAF